MAGGKLKQVGTLRWESPNLGAKNEFCFNAIPGGWAYIYYGNMGFNAIWWTSTGSVDKAWARSTYYSRESLDRTFFRTVYGLSVRCVRD